MADSSLALAVAPHSSHPLSSELTDLKKSLNTEVGQLRLVSSNEYWILIIPSALPAVNFLKLFD
ncbi:hypothetical protein Sjap_007506 [Stephania japonica]|uniref:Uncharacterized protein n=1 Tax=Stephania japonica TaxID=461633 RepID=A0AAP0PAH7_9MAGN